jgi:cytochrome P450
MLPDSPPRPTILANPWPETFRGQWVIYSYDLAMQALRLDGRGFQQGDLYDGEGACRYPDAVVVAATGETHRRLRKQIVEHFTRERVEHYTKTLIDREADSVVERLLRAGGGDLQQEAVEFTWAVSAALLGVDGVATAEIFPAIEDWIYHQSWQNLPQAERAFRTMKDLVAPSIARRRTDPQSDIYTTQLQFGDDDEVVLERAAMIVYASLHFTPMAVCRTAYLLDEHHFEKTTDHDALVAAFYETIRLMPVAPVLQRRATEAVELGGAQIAAGDLIIIDVASTNTDPAVYGDDARLFRPGRPLVGRALPGGLNFSAGPHSCLGEPIAREMVVALLARLHAADMRIVRPWSVAPRPNSYYTNAPVVFS